MTKKDYIKYWVDTANDDWLTINVLVKSKRYFYALFLAHLTLEKLCKAHWVKDNTENHSPRIHNLISIIKSTKLALSDEQMKFLVIMNTYQLEGRYPEYTYKLQGTYKEKNTKEILKQVNEIRLCLQKDLQ